MPRSAINVLPALTWREGQLLSARQILDHGLIESERGQQRFAHS